ncbi:hypothetical protein DES49_1304 [Halospina denitrificans]|uniref:Lipoprotein n=1 Tax=Halospina denitrificans TaxID=332522 RepID=A0A4R7JZD7_9GAMM|nr:hypothetical protein [Halospina denitrificans]TDT43486.1 hypothetical protein DES49_1304 [Halospina denitrificans]
MRSLASATILTRFNKQLNKGSIFGVLASGLLLAGCGGGGGGSSDNDPETSTDSVSETSTSNLLEAVDPGAFVADVERPDELPTPLEIALLSPSGRVVLLYNRNAITSAEIDFDQDRSFSGPGTDIYYSGDEWVQNEGKLEGEAVSKSVIKGEAKSTSDDPRTSFTLTRDGPASAQGASLEAVGGRTYSEQDASSETSQSITIDKDGTLTGSYHTGSDQKACTFNGNVSVPDERFNVYEVSFEATGCGDDLRNGTYTGLAMYDQRDPDRLVIIAENGEVTGVFISD